ncbi:hypothetical protein [Alphaproteobacteria bacterium endosymbiont of Tiliacea citrago]|uniref:hypothetical protein n=1 Tax=Alphaproteobacteria bacterium endosymbiont of Tiliacea citrago TaxID=3077944 RepID=UPI00313E6510
MIKKDGIILFKKKVSANFCLCKILFSDSVIASVLVKINDSKIFLSVGHQVFGALYTKDQATYFSIESIESFIATSFWDDQNKLLIISKINQYIIEFVPENLIIDQIYEQYILCVKLILKKDTNVCEKFKNWVRNQIK